MTIVVHEYSDDGRCKRCLIARSLAGRPQLCPGKPPSAREAARLRWPLDGADAQALEAALSLTERERDRLIGHGCNGNEVNACALLDLYEQRAREAESTLRFLRQEYQSVDSHELTRDALELKAQVLEASLLHVCKAASEITSWDFSHLLLEHPDAKTLLGDVAALEAALKQHGPERS